jgi:hypothetical protein
MALHHEGTKGTKGAWDTETIQHGANSNWLLLLFFVFFVFFVPSFCS